MIKEKDYNMWLIFLLDNFRIPAKRKHVLDYKFVKSKSAEFIKEWNVLSRSFTHTQLPVCTDSIT